MRLKLTPDVGLTRATIIADRKPEVLMGYKTCGAKVKIEIIKNGTEVLVMANREGLVWLSEICAELSDDEPDEHEPPHVHVEPALNTAEPQSIPMEILFKANLK